MPSKIIVAVGVPIVMLMMALALSSGYQSAADRVDVDNETWTPDAGNVTELNGSFSDPGDYSDNATVFDENGTLQSEGTDYEWFQNNGTVKALVGGGLENDNNATISYTYLQATQRQQNQMRILSALFETTTWIPILLILVIVFGMLTVFGGLS